MLTHTTCLLIDTSFATLPRLSGPAPKPLTSEQVSDLLQRVSVFHTYAVAHAKTSDEMAKRAESRLQDAKLAVTEAKADEEKAAEQQAAAAIATAGKGSK